MSHSLLERLDPESLNLVREIGALAQAQGMDAYLVGGPVRDLHLNCFKGDLDITVEGKGMKVAEIFARAHHAELVGYAAFKTATVALAYGRMVDFATARKEAYVRPGAFPAVTASNLRDDLFRRDFTINAMAIALNPKQWGTLIDPFKGAADLKAKKIRVLHKKSFIDDPTRILRAARFKARLHFAVERGTQALIKEAVEAGVMDTIKPQRYQKEIDKILKEQNPQPALDLIERWHAVKQAV